MAKTVYQCLICGVKFDEPYPKYTRGCSRYSPEYGDTATMVCPVCGEESYMKIKEGEDEQEED